MKIKVNDLQEGEALFEDEVDPQLLDADAEGIELVGPITLSVKVEKFSGQLMFDVTARGAHHCICSRCLDEFDNPLDKEFSFQLESKNLEEVNIDDYLREEIILDNPLRVLCSKNCKGLCVGCGANLNHERCGCRVGQ